jgi:MHS family proline/betaine transporter-like MFS transporter
LLAMYSGPAGATVAEMFPTRIRSKWLGIGYGLSVAIFGGFTPFVVTWLIRALDSPLAPAYYVIAAALIGGIFILFINETAKDELR